MGKTSPPVHIGSKVTTIKAGDRVGVGAAILSCTECNLCKGNNEQYCPKHVSTYSVYPESGTISTGGYSTAMRALDNFVFPIPDDIKLEDAASMFCGGVKVFSPLKGTVLVLERRWESSASEDSGISASSSLWRLAVMRLWRSRTQNARGKMP